MLYWSDLYKFINEFIVIDDFYTIKYNSNNQNVWFLKKTYSSSQQIRE